MTKIVKFREVRKSSSKHLEALDKYTEKAQKVWAFFIFWSKVKSSVVESFKDVKSESNQRVLSSGGIAMSTSYQGACLCGSIKYEVSKLEPRMGHCHCSMCRKFHGAAFATLGEALAENFRWVEGESLLKTYLAPNGTQRKFCENCGSSLIFEAAGDDGRLVEFALGTLDSDIELKPDAHIFCESGANWCELSDDLPKLKAGRDSEAFT